MRCAVLDDYQQVALTLADWALLSGVQVTSLARPFQTEDALVNQRN